MRTGVRMTVSLAQNVKPYNGVPPQAPQSVDPLDAREQLANNGAIGPVSQVSLPAHLITSLRGILIDIDPGMWTAVRHDPQLADHPDRFFERIVRRMTQRNPILARAEVRSSGRGLHVIVWLASPVEFKSVAERDRWADIVKAVQRLLPSDPNCPGITALTRPINSVNSKNNRTVEQLHAGARVRAEEVIAMVGEMDRAKFRAVAKVILGDDRNIMCPKCRGKKLHINNHAGKCYDCGDIELSHVYDSVLVPSINSGVVHG